MPYKILIVEDQEMAARQASLNIRKMGYVVAGVCVQGKEAIEFVRENPVDLVLMDIMLPGEIDGIEAAAEINALNVAVLIITALDSDELLEKAKVVNAYGYLVKPYSNGDFKRSVETALNLHQLRNKLRESEDRYRAVINDQLEMVCRFYPNGELTFFNKSFSEFFNPESDGNRPANINRNITIKDREALNKSLAEITREAPVSKSLLRIVKGVKICWLEFIIRGFFNAEGKIREYQAVAREISDKVMAEESLKKITDRYHIISEMTSDFIYTGFITDDAGIKLDWIAGPYTKLTGWTFDDYKGFPQGVLSIVHPEDMGQFPTIVERALKNKSCTSIYRARMKTGEWLWFRDYMRPVWDEYDRKVTRVIGAVQNITEFKKTEIALKQSEERFKFALAASADGYWDWDVANNRFFVSARSMQIFGRAPESIEIAASDAENLVHPADRERYVKCAYAALNGETEDFTIKGKFIHATEGYRYILSRGKVALRDQQGKPLRITGVHIDISEKYEAEQKAERFQEKFSKAFNSSPVMMSITTLEDGVYLEVNESFLKNTGFAREEVIGRTAKDVGVWADFAKREEMKRELLRNGAVKAGKNRMKTRNGELLDIIHYIEILEIDGEKRLLSSIMDITDFNREKAHRTFVEETLKAVMEASPVGVGFHIERQIVWVNDKFCELTGYTNAELVGKSSETVYASKKEYERIGSIAYGEGGQSNGISAEVRCQRKDGGIVDFFVFNHQVDPDDPKKGYIFVVIDITETKREERERSRAVKEKLELEVKEAKAQALLLEASKYASVGAVIAGILHEINQPLNAIKMGAEGLLSWNKIKSQGKSKLPSQAVSVLGSFSVATERIEGILNRLDAYRRNVNTTAVADVNLNECAACAVGLVRESLLTHRVELELELSERPIFALANSLTIELVITALLNYIIKLLDKKPLERKKLVLSTGEWNGKAIASISGQALEGELDGFASIDPLKEAVGEIDIEPEIIKMYVEQFGGSVKAVDSEQDAAKIIIELDLADEASEENR